MRNNISQKEFVSQVDFLNAISDALGVYENSPDKSRYVKNGELTLRLANHRGNALTFYKNEELNGNTSIVIKMSEKRFRPHKDVQLEEFVYYPDKFNKEKQLDIVNGIINWLDNGIFNGTLADQKNVSPIYYSVASRAEQAQREYDEVVARYTNPDGTKKDGWLKAPNGKPTNLTERQWVQVRTPSFKAWFGDWEALEIQKWLEGDPVASATGEEYKDVPRKSIEDAIVEYFSNKGIVDAINPELGKVNITKAGIHDSIFKGVGRNKIAVFNYIPQIISKGKVVVSNVSWKDRAYDTSVIVAPVSIAGNAYVAFVVVRKHSNGDNNFYLHEVGLLADIKNEAERINDTGLSPEGDKETRPFGSIKNIAKALYAVNPNSVSKIVDENGESIRRGSLALRQVSNAFRLYQRLLRRKAPNLYRYPRGEVSNAFRLYQRLLQKAWEEMCERERRTEVSNAFRLYQRLLRGRKAPRNH